MLSSTVILSFVKYISFNIIKLSISRSITILHLSLLNSQARHKCYQIQTIVKQLLSKNIQVHLQMTLNQFKISGQSWIGELCCSIVMIYVIDATSCSVPHFPTNRHRTQQILRTNICQIPNIIKTGQINRHSITDLVSIKM